MSVETWANLNVFVEDKAKEPPSREEWLRLERVAVGKVCGCKSCLCCEELNREVNRAKP